MKDYIIATLEELDYLKKYESDKSEYKKVNPPFGYFGSKNKIALKLCQDLPPHNCWVEAFCGSSSLTLAKKPAPIEVINDINGDIVNLFRQLRNNHDELIRLITLTPYSRQEFDESREKKENDSDIERARKFLIQAMMAINGVFGEAKGGFSYSQSYSRNGKDARVSRWYNLPTRLSQVVERIRCVRVDNRDASDILQMFINRPATLIYLDPPYLGDRAKGYVDDLNDVRYHENLLRISNKSKSMIFISGYENELYESLLTEKNGWKRKTIETSTKDTKGNSHPRSEVVWMNKNYQKALSNNQIPIKLTEKELKGKKLNPER